jgi:isopenicillin N synthase-like dioxygenase
VQVPIIDLGGWGTSRSAAVAEAVDHACTTVGFMQIVGHGIDPDVIEQMLAAADGFFMLPLEEKLRAAPPHPGINRGYAALGTEALSYSLGVEQSPPDLFEAFNVGPEHVDRSDPVVAADPHDFFAPNVWPARPASMADAFSAYFDQAHRVALLLTDVFAVALGLADGWFAPFVDRSTVTMRAVRYERHEDQAAPAPTQMRMGAHTDYGMVTVLYADPVPGLQIVGPDGTWHDVVPAPGALLVNLGDLTAQWTNDRWRSTMHRVVPPSTADGPVVRRSAAFFFDANHDALITCVPTCATADRPAMYPPVVAGEHLIAKVLGPRTLTASNAVDTAGERLGLA